MDDVHNNIEEYNPNEIRKMLILFDDITADKRSNKKPNLIVAELFIKGRKLNISVVFITQYYFSISKKYWLFQHVIFS